MLNLTYLSPNPVLPPGISVEIRCHLKAESLESCSDLSFPAYESSLLPPPVFTTASLNLLNYQEPFNWFHLVIDKTTVSIDNKSTFLSEVHACFALNHQGERPCCHPHQFLLLSQTSASQLLEFFRWWAWWSKPAAPMFRILRKEDHESEARLNSKYQSSQGCI